MIYKYMELGKLYKIESGGTPSRKNKAYFENGKIPWVKTGELKSRYIFNASEYITDLGLKESSARIFPKETVLLAMYGATIGCCSILGIDAATNQACAAFIPNELIVPEYLYYFFLSKREFLINQSVGGAQPNLSAYKLKKIEIHLPPLETQKKITQALDKAQELIDKRKEQIEKLDEFLQSVFLDFFGDPVNNHKGWKCNTLDELGDLKSGGTPSRGNNDFFNGTIPWITTVALGKIYVDRQDAKNFITEEAIKDSATKLIPINSILIGARVGVGKASINKCVICTNQDILSLINIKEFLNRIYILFVLKYYENYFNSQKRGATIQGITSSTLKNIKIPIPSLDLQNKFAHIVERTEQQKNLLEKSLTEMENNFNSIMQKAFRGELFN